VAAAFTKAFEDSENADKIANEAWDDHNLQLEIEETAPEQDTSKGLCSKKNAHFTETFLIVDTKDHKLHLNIAHQWHINIINTLLPDALQKAGSLRITAWKFKRHVHDLLVQVDMFGKDIDDLGKDLNDAVEYAVDNVSKLKADHTTIIENML